MACSFWRSSHYLEWLLDRQDVLRHRAADLRILGNEEDYQKIMSFFAEVIHVFGKSVEVRQQVIATATVYFRRFYSRTSLKSIDPWLMTTSCIFLASKVEEFGVLSHKNLMTACCKAVSTQFSKYFNDYGYPYRVQDIFECEFILMEAMDCSLIVFHPYRPLVQFCEDLRPHMLHLTDCLLERAWHIVNDSLRTDLCLHYPPYLIALGCLQLAFISLEKNPPSDGVTGGNCGSNDNPISSIGLAGLSNSNQQLAISPLAVAEHWFSELVVNMERVLEVSRQLLALYDLWQRFDPDTEMPKFFQTSLFRSNVQSLKQQSSQSQVPNNNTISHSPICPNMEQQQQLRHINNIVPMGNRMNQSHAQSGGQMGH